MISYLLEPTLTTGEDAQQVGENLIIAIDGPAGAGKSSVAKALSAHLNIDRLDTGSMYRAVAAAALSHLVDLHDFERLVALSRGLEVTSEGRCLVHGEDVSHALRDPETNTAVSVVAATSEVRTILVALQRSWARDRSMAGVIEGRDIASVVFPDARLKIYLTASVEERARRRSDEGAASILRRDQVDTSRTASPLVLADGSHELDTTGRSIEDVTSEILSWLQ
jgi:cytidylate kinase